MDRLTELAISIADHAARSDIECWAHMVNLNQYDLTKPQDDRDGADQAQQLDAVARAAHYIALRGDALPFRLVRTGEFAWFEDR